MSPRVAACVGRGLPPAYRSACLDYRTPWPRRSLPTTRGACAWRKFAETGGQWQLQLANVVLCRHSLAPATGRRRRRGRAPAQEWPLSPSCPPARRGAAPPHVTHAVPVAAVHALGSAAAPAAAALLSMAYWANLSRIFSMKAAASCWPACCAPAMFCSSSSSSGPSTWLAATRARIWGAAEAGMGRA